MKLRILLTILVFGITCGTSRMGLADITLSWTNKALSGFDPAETAVIDAALASWSVLIDDLGPAAFGRTSIEASITQAVDPSLGSAFSLVADAMGIPLSGSITIDDGTGTGLSFFVDPTPGADTEYLATAFPHYGTVKTGGAASGFDKDLLSVVNHELGHLLGFSDSYSRFATAHIGPMLVYGPLKTATLGSGAGHLSPTAHMFDLMADAADPFSARRLQSTLDLDVLAGLYGYTVDPAALRSIAPIPLPGALGCFAASLVLLIARVRAISRAGVRGVPNTRLAITSLAFMLVEVPALP